MGPFEMVVAIVIVVTIGSVVRAKHGIGRDRQGRDYALRNPDAEAENVRLREELRAIKDRVAVLERLATDSSTSLDREIEKLRDRTSDRA